MRLTKKLSLILLGIVLATCVSVSAVLSLTPVKATAPATFNTFTTENGAYIRVKDEVSTVTGLKFLASISKDEYLSAKASGENVTFGMAIARVDNLTDLMLLANHAEASSKVHIPMQDGKWEEGYSPDDEVETLKYTYIINNIDTSNYNVNYTALAYVDIDGVKTYSNNNGLTAPTRSPFIVAVNGITEIENTYGVDTYAHEIISSVNPTLTFDKEVYNYDGSDIFPTVKVGDVQVNVEIVSENPEIVTIVDGKLVKQSIGTATLKASVKGMETDVFEATATVEISKISANASLAVDGILTFDTNDEETTLLVNDGTSNIIEKTLPVSATSVDAYKEIIDYRVANDIVAGASYTVTVSSDNYEGSATTATITALTDVESLKTAVGTGTLDSVKVSGTYYYLTQNLSVNQNSKSIEAKSKAGAVFLSSVATSKSYINLDGRGYTVSASMDNYKGGTRLMFDWLDGCNFKNVKFDYFGNLANSNGGTMAYGIQHTVFTNCYFKLKSGFNASYPTSPTQPSSIARGMRNVDFNNCVIELIDNYAGDSWGVGISGSGDSGASNIVGAIDLNNSAIIYAKEGATMADMFYNFTNDGDTSSSSIYASLTNFVGNGDNYANFGDAWTISGTEIKLCGNTVATIS